LLTILSPLPTSFAATPLPRDSVYQLNVQLIDDRSRAFTWGSSRGQPQVVSMLYTSCKFVCPMIVDSGKAIEQALSPAERSQLRFTIITFDPRRDTPQALARLRRDHDLDAMRWTLARPDPRDTRALAGLLGVRYRELADGEFNHTSALVLLDAEGRVIARTERIGGLPDPAFLAAVQKTLAPQP
jgi:protein SCO1/2